MFWLSPIRTRLRTPGLEKRMASRTILFWPSSFFQLGTAAVVGFTRGLARQLSITTVRRFDHSSLREAHSSNVATTQESLTGPPTLEAEDEGKQSEVNATTAPFLTQNLEPSVTLDKSSGVRSRNEFTVAEDKLILAEYQRGESFAEIGRRLGRRRGVIQRRHHTIHRRQDVTTAASLEPIKSKVFSTLQDELIVQMKQEGASVYKIAKKIADLAGQQFRHSHEKQVGNRILQLRSNGMISTSSTQREPLPEDDFLRLKALRDNGFTWERIARREQQPAARLRGRYLTQARKSMPAKSYHTWTSEEVATMRRFREQEGLKFSQIADRLDRQTAAVVNRYRRLSMDTESYRPKAARWSVDEDSKLVGLIKKYGKKWSIIQPLMSSRSGESLRKRYEGYLYDQVEPTSTDM